MHSMLCNYNQISPINTKWKYEKIKTMNIFIIFALSKILLKPQCMASSLTLCLMSSINTKWKEI